LKTKEFLTVIIISAALIGFTRPPHGAENPASFQLSQMEHMKMQDHEKMPAQSRLQPAQGASVKILTPKKAQVIKGDNIPLTFKLVKGKRGDHVHAYVDGELMGMFKGEKGTLTGIKPGQHVLELRVVAEDHQTELDASDKVGFVVK